MAKGKFQSGNNARSAQGAGPYAARHKTKRKAEKIPSRLWPILAAVAGVLVLVVGILILTKDRQPAAPTDASTQPPATVELAGLPRAELERKFQALDDLLRNDLTLTLQPLAGEDGQTEEPIVVTLTREAINARLDLTKLAADLDAGVGQEQGDSYLLDPRDYLTLDEAALRTTMERVAAEFGTQAERWTVKVEPDPEDEGSEDQPPRKILVLRTGTVGRDLDVDRLCETALQAYSLALIAEDPAAALQPTLSYKLTLPEPLDVDTLWDLYCKDPVDPEIDRKTGEITDGKDGYGFDREALEAALETAAPGQELRFSMGVLKPEQDAETLRETLFRDVLAEAHTPHSSVYNRTINLKLACAAIDGTILMPGDVFSFNEVVGQRTEEKGYKEAIAYVSGGASKPELGGGVCQVASSIYYAVLQADLKTLEREPHMFVVDYVPKGMDATIYWGYLDYKFENDSPYPIKIEASVSNGKVHITLLGTEWKDYTVELSNEILETEKWEVIEKDVPDDGSYYKGEVITTPYTGYKVATYKTTKDKTTGKTETTQIAISKYKKRDKVVANPTATANPTQPTEPPTQPTEPPTQPTEPPTQPTEPPTQPTEPPTQPTEPPTEPTQPPTEPTEPPTEPTEPSTEPSEPPSEPSEPPEGGD